MDPTDAMRILVLGVAAIAWPTLALSQVGAATCATLPPVVPAGQVRANGTAVTLAGGTYAPTTAGAPAFFAINNGSINATAAVALVTSSANTATACTATGGSIRFQSPGSTVSRLGTGGPAVRAEAGTTVVSAGTRFYTSLANSDGVQLVGASFTGTSDLITSGVTLGTQAGVAASYGLPVDASGNVVTDPAQFVGKAATAAHGINADAAQVRLNVDAAGNPIGGTTSIYILGTGAGATTGSYGLNGTSGSIVDINRVRIVTRGNNNAGIRLASTSRLTASSLLIDTTGTVAHGVWSSDASTGSFNGVDVRVAGQNAHGVLAQSGSSLRLSGDGSVVIAAGQAGNALRADGAGSFIGAEALRISTLRNSGVGATAINAASADIARSTLFSSGIAGGNSAVGLIVGAGGTLISRGNLILVGAKVGTDPALPSYGLPVDGAGNVTLDPAAFVASGTTGAVGAQVAATGGSLWLDVDPGGAPQSAATEIATYGNNSSGVVAGKSANATTTLDAARTVITTHGISSNGVLIQGTTGSTGPQANLSQVAIRTIGLNSNAVYGQAGAQVVLDGAFLATSGGGVGVRADGAGTLVSARNVTIGAAGVGGAGLNATGGTIKSANTFIVNAARPAMTLNASGGTAGTLISDGDTLYTGVLLGTDLEQPTFGRPIDALGNAIADPTQFVASGLTGHGVFAGVPNGRVWMNVDPSTGVPTGSQSSITTLGNISEGFNISGANALATAANVHIATRGVDSIGARASGSGEIRGAGLSVSTTGQHGYGLAAYENSLVTATGTDIVTTGAQAHGLIAWSDNGRIVLSGTSSVQTSGQQAHAAIAWNGGRLDISDSALTTTGRAASALFVRGDPAAATASASHVTFTSAGGPTVGASGTASIALAGSTVTSPNLWLMTGAPDDFEPLDAAVPDVPPEQPDDPVPRQAVLAAPSVSPTPTVATVTVTQSQLAGAALTMPGSTANLTLKDSVWNLTGNSNLSNLTNDSGLIAFGPPIGEPSAPGSYKTLAVNNYRGDGTLAMNTFLGADDSPSDRLIIGGGTGSGSSELSIRRAAGEGAFTAADGILLVSAIGGATTTTSAFHLGSRVIAGPYEYTLQRGSVDGTAPDSWFLRSSVDCAAAGAPSPPCSAPPTPAPPVDPPDGPPGPPVPPAPPGPIPKPVPNYRPEVSLYAALAPTALNYGRALLDSLHERVGEQELLLGRHARDDGRDGPQGMWSRVIHVEGERDGAKSGIYGSGPSYDYEFSALQLGLDLYRDDDADRHSDKAGIYAAAGGADATPSGIDGATVGHDRIHGYTVGGYLTRYGTASLPWYVDAIAQATWYQARAQSASGGLPALDSDGPGYALSLEGGYPFVLNSTWTLEPQAQVDYSWIHLRSSSDLGARIHFDDNDSLVGRLSARLSRQWNQGDDAENPRQSTAWSRIGVLHEFRGNPATSFSSATGDIPFRADMRGSWWEVELGLTHELARDAFFFGNVGYSEGFDNDRRAWEGKLGIRFNW